MLKLLTVLMVFIYYFYLTILLTIKKLHSLNILLLGHNQAITLYLKQDKRTYAKLHRNLCLGIQLTLLSSGKTLDICQKTVVSFRAA